MSMLEEEPAESESDYRPCTIYTYSSENELVAMWDLRRRPWPAEVAAAAPSVEVSYDRSRHVIRITEQNGKTAEFDDRPERLLLMIRNPVTKALEPVIDFGKPVYYYLAREVSPE